MAVRVGLVGYACSTGVGLVTRDFSEHLPFDRWLAVEHRTQGIECDWLDERCTIWRTGDSLEGLDRWLDGLDVIFSIERNPVPGLWMIARHKGVRITVMPNAEWLTPDAAGLRLIDLLIAPTEACAQYLRDCGLGDRVEYIPHAVDTRRFAFVRRERVERYVHCRGWGGVQGRKGTDIVLAVARRCPELPFIVHYQQPPDGEWPGNVVLCGPKAEAGAQYAAGDVAIQPSRWEGVGLQILEAMACGLPTVVPDASPMNEYPVDRDLCVYATSRSVDLGHKTWPAWECDVAALTSLVRRLYGQPIGELSAATRARMEARSWERLSTHYLQALGMSGIWRSDDNCASGIPLRR
jgi:glycosyltransferase involved in cell wall biosynthesis